MGESQLGSLRKKYSKPVVYMLTGGLEYLVGEAGGELQGFSMRPQYGDALVVVRAEFEGKAMVAFASSATGAGAISRLHKELRGGKLKWRPDKYKNGE